MTPTDDASEEVESAVPTPKASMRAPPWILVKVTRDENLHVVPPHAVEPVAGPKAIGKDIAAVERAAGLLSFNGWPMPANVIGVH
jgi:hypothetical protein